jgi:hypothetical protein
MRLRALFRTGWGLFVASGLLSVAKAVAGVDPAWLNWILAILSVAGIVDMGIAASYDLRRRLRGEDGNLCAAVEFDETGIHCWFGDRAQENRRRFLEERAGRPLSRSRLADGAFRGMAYPAGLSYRPPYGAPWPPEKQLAPPPDARRQFPGVEFPEQPSYAYRDRHGIQTPPFPVHFQTLPDQHDLIDGARMAHAVMRYHTDSRNPGCPVCETWEREWGVFHG